MFEEPELYLHPKVAYKLRESLYELSANSPYQILCATHSPLMIDISKDHSSLVRIFKNDTEQTQTFQIENSLFNVDEENRLRVQMLNRFNPHVCEAFYADKVLLVEGDTETIVYRDLLKRFFIDKEIFVVNTGSKNNIPFYQEVLIHFQIEHYIIHDSDQEINSNGNRNSAWTLNQTIWDNVVRANNVKQGLARRYLHIKNFEDAHKRFDQNLNFSGKDKPYKAYQFAQSINLDSDVDCLNWLKDIIENQSILHDQEYLTRNLNNNGAN